MSKSKNYKVNKQLTKSQNELSRAKFINQCDCLHQADRQPTLEAYKNNNSGEEAYKCTQCDAIIAKSIPTAQDVKEAINTVDTAISYIKMLSNPENEKSKKDLDSMRATQKALRKIGIKYENMLTERSKRQEQRHNRTKKAAYYGG